MVSYLIAICAVLLTLFPAYVVSAAQQVSQTLHNHVRAEVLNKTAPLVSTLPAEQQLQLSIILPLQNQAGLTSLLGRLYDPASPDFHHFLSVDQFTAQFGPSADSFQAVVDFAKANGLTVGETPANRLIVPVRGSVEAVNRTLQVSMNVYQHPTENRTFFSPDREPSLPANLHVAHISGLNNFSLPHPAVVRPQGAQPMAVNGSGPGGSYLGSDMRAAYYGGTALTGLGQSVGLVEFDGYDVADVNATFANAGQSYTVPLNNVLLDGATGAGSEPDTESEVVLDIVQAIGMAPGLDQVRVYIGMGSDEVHILNSMASENIAKILSCSWGWIPDDVAAEDVFFQEFAAQGQTFVTASGDSGAFDSALSPYFHPQEDAYVTAVGGTHLTTTAPGGTWVSETTWNASGAGSGGGISPDNVAIPSWQTGIANSANAGSATLRNVPDVAMEGDFDNYSCSFGECQGDWAGTSFAAPRWAGFLALVNQQAVEAGTAPQGGIGFVNPALYRIAQSANYASDFHDVTVGTNQTRNQPIWFSAVAGYDLVTGWGSAKGQSLIDDLAGPQVPGFWLQSSLPTVDIDQGTSTSATLTVTDAGGFSGPVTLAITSALPSGVTASWGTNPTQGTSVLTLTSTSNAAPSTTPVTITGTSGTLTAQTTINVAVHAPTFLLSAMPSSVALNQGATTTTTITVQPKYGFTGAVNLAVSGVPSGVTATLDTNPTSGTSVLSIAASDTATPGNSSITITGTAGSLSVTLTVPLSIHGPSFTLSGSSTIDIGQGASGTEYVNIIDLYGFKGSVDLAVTGLPAGVTASFTSNPATTSSSLVLNAAASAAVGSSTLTITGISGNLTASTTTTLGVHAPTFTLSNPGTVVVGQGSSGSAYLYVSPQYGFTGSVTFSVSGLPAGVTALWNPNPTNGNTTLTLAAESTAALGQYNLAITGTSGGHTATTTLSLGIYAPTFTLSSAGSVSVGQGSSNSGYVDVNPQYGFNGSVTLTATGLPAGVTASFSPNPATGYGTVTFTASSSAALGQYSVTITGTSGAKTASTVVNLGVYQPTFSIATGSGINIGQGTTSTASVYINAQYGFTGSVNLAISGLPAGVTASFSPNPSTTYATLTLTASSTAALGQYTATITGTSGTKTVTTTLTVGVYVPTFTLSGGGNLSAGQGNSASAYLYVYGQYGFNGSVAFSVSGLPAGVTATFSPNPSTYATQLTFAVANTAPLGQYTVTVTGISGGTTASTTLTLGIYAPTFTLSGGSQITVGQGNTATSYISVFGQYGFSGNVTFTVAGLPAGVTATFSPNPTSYSTLLTVTASGTAALGQYTLTVTGTSGSLSASTALSLGVYAPTFQLNGPYGNVSLNQGATQTASFYVLDQYGFSGPVTLTATGLPSGVTASFSPNPLTYSSTMTLTASSSATPGQAAVVVTGTSSGVTSSVTVNVTVNASSFSLGVAPGQATLGVGGSSNASVTVAPLNGFAGPVTLAISGLPSGVTGSFSSGSITSSGVLSLSASPSAATGTYTATITGTSGTLTASVPVKIVLAAPPTATTTSVAVVYSGTAVTSVTAGSAVSLTGSVLSGSAKVTAGQVAFCDTTASTCDAAHQVGTAQLTSSGSATLTFLPGPGTHNYRAAFLGTSLQATSVSAPASLAVAASQASTTTIAESGSAGQYTLTATVSGQGSPAPSGSVDFLDTSNGNAKLGTATLSSTATSLSYAAAQTTTTNFPAVSTAVADFNGDGTPDLAVVNQTGNSVAILLGKGDGTFVAAGNNLATGNQPLAVVASDFNADGKMDLAVANSSSGSISVFLGNGDGSFSPAALSAQTGAYPQAMTVADLNGDGKLDLAVVNGSSTLTILLGNGDGSFTPSPLTPQAGSGLETLATADFNGDGVPDLAVISSYTNTVAILLGNGDGTFSPAAPVATSSGPASMVTGDFNQDGRPDLAIVYSYSGNATILLGKGDSTFTASTVTVPQLYTQNSVAVADLNSDGHQDIIVGGYGKAVALLGNGDGTFAPGPSLTVSSAPSFVISDVNGDGVPDLLVPTAYANNLSLFTGQLAQTSRAVATGVNAGSAGTHAVDASYRGDSAWRGSNSSTTPLIGQMLTATLTATGSAATITTVQPLTVSLSVAGPSGAATPTGSVSLSGGGYQSPGVTLVNGVATITVPAGSLAAGTAALTAQYTPDTASASTYGSASGAVAITVTAAPKTTPTVTLTPSSSNINTTQSLNVVVAVNGASGYPTPTGSITITGGGYTSPATSLSGGKAMVSVAAGALATGPDVLTATFTPDSNGATTFNAATGATTITVTGLKTTPAMTALPSAMTINAAQSLSVAVHVTGASGTATPTGTVIIAGGGYTSAATALNAGAATISVPAASLSVGADTLTASFTPDTVSAALYNGATSTFAVTVAPAPKSPTVSLVASASSITIAQKLTIAVSVSGSAGDPVATGSVTLTVGSTTAQQTLNNGASSFTIAAGSLPVGANTLKVSYAPDAGSTAAYTSASQTITVNVAAAIGTAAATVTLSASPTSATDTQSVAVVASVTGAVGQVGPSGSVVLTTGNFSAQQNLTNGAATFNLPGGTLGAGQNSLTVAYSGDATYGSASASIIVTQSPVVIAAATPNAIAPGAVASSALTVSAGTYSGTLSLTCLLTSAPSNAQGVPTCNLSPAAVQVASGGTATSTVSVVTTAASAASALPFGGWRSGAYGVTAFASVLVLLLPSRRRLRLPLLALLLGVVLPAIVGCGSGNSSTGNSPGGPTTQATTRGQYIYTITGTDAANPKLSVSTSFTVTVQ